MTQDRRYVTDWVREIEAQSKRFSVLFVQLGAAYRPVRSVLSTLGGQHVTVQEYLEHGLAIVQDDASPLVILDSVELLVDKMRRRTGELRAQVMADLEMGLRFILVSARGRGAFPPVPGSSLIEDAKVVNGPLVPETERIDERGLAALPAYNPGEGMDGDQLLADILMEADSELLAALEYVCWERFEGPASSLGVLSAKDLVDLRSCGLVQLQDGEPQWHVTDCWKPFRFAVADAASRLTTAPAQIDDTYRRLWEIERTLRMLVGVSARALKGDGWRKSLFSQAEMDRILESARRDTLPNAQSVADLRDPLEWLTLSELLDLRMNKRLGDLGIAHYFWPKVVSDLVPIRNRIAHNRIPRDGDHDTVRKWHSIICSDKA